jgi:hypothetical protein
MSTGNNIENKTRFEALYYGQKVLAINAFESKGLYIVDFKNVGSKNTSLYLRSISNLTDEEYKWFANHSAYKLDDKNIVAVGKSMVKAMFEPNGWSGNTLQQMCDYLRSIGILIPWMDLSVETIIAYGWAKIKED